MERVYMQLIAAKRKTIDDVPEKYKQTVLDILKNEKNLDGYGNPIEDGANNE